VSSAIPLRCAWLRIARVAGRVALIWLSATGWASAQAPAPADTAPADTAPADTAPADTAPDAGVPSAAEAPPAELHEVGTVSGRVLARGPGTAVDGVSVFVEGLDVEATSDSEGRFSLQVPVGRHTLWLIHKDFPTLTLPNVDAAAGRDTRITVELLPPTAQQDDWVIRAHYVAGGVASILEERRKASTVSDALGSEEIAKSPDSSASSATRRIVGASIVGGQYLFARGLGGRYTNVRLNGVPLPSTDPDLPGFQLDLFPASLLSSLTITKTFSPDIPGDFAGGSLNVITKAFPEKFKLTLSTSVTYNTQTTGKELPSYEGGARDALGFDDGTRALPDAVPPERVWTGSGLGIERLGEIGASFPNVWKVESRRASPNLSFGASVGDTLSGSAGRFGYLLTLGYRHRFEHYNETVTRVGLGPVPEGGSEPSVVEVESLEREVGMRDAQIGALGAMSYEPEPGQRLSLVSVLTQTGEDRATHVAGYSEAEGTPIENTQLRFIERQLFFNQLRGQHEHVFDVLSVNWHLNASRTLRDQPSTRDLLYAEGPNGYAFRSVSGSGERLYSELQNLDYGGGLDVEWALGARHALKLGYLGHAGTRDFAARRFGIQFEGTAADRLLPPEQLFAPERSGGTWLIDELTQPEDGYAAREDLNAAYAMFDGQLHDALKLMGGVRLENFHQKIDVSSPFALTTDEPPPGADRTDLDYLPALALILSPRDDMNVRLGYGGTVARPLVRELAPFLNQDFVRRRYAVGNPDLQRTYIHNFDARWELFPTPTEVFAVSGFYKLFQHPIETVVLDQNGNLSYDNIEGATNFGAELEARFGLGTLAPLLSSFNLLANLALIYSSVSLTPEEQRLATNANRPLAGQSPYVANLALGYDSDATGISIYVYYNVFGRRIQDVGRLGLPDVYEEAFHALDATVFWKIGSQLTLGASASNLLLSSMLQTQGGHDFSRSERGSNFGLNLSWSP
jgi:TonB dependent receptor/Carboxypeptidase regulatory-like domain/TonB-dependent Receptor Plug Domain